MKLKVYNSIRYHIENSEEKLVEGCRLKAAG